MSGGAEVKFRKDEANEKKKSATHAHLCTELSHTHPHTTKVSRKVAVDQSNGCVLELQ